MIRHWVWKVPSIYEKEAIILWGTNYITLSFFLDLPRRWDSASFPIGNLVFRSWNETQPFIACFWYVHTSLVQLMNLLRNSDLHYCHSRCSQQFSGKLINRIIVLECCEMLNDLTLCSVINFFSLLNH